jgi:hypothetical protein
MDASVSAVSDEKRGLKALPDVAGVEDIARLDEEQLARVQAEKKKLQEKEEMTHQTYIREREMAVAAERTKAEAELARFKDEELRAILQKSQENSVAECDQLAVTASKNASVIEKQLTTLVASGDIFHLAA